MNFQLVTSSNSWCHNSTHTIIQERTVTPVVQRSQLLMMWNMSRCLSGRKRHLLQAATHLPHPLACLGIPRRRSLQPKHLRRRTRRLTPMTMGIRKCFNSCHNIWPWMCDECIQVTIGLWSHVYKLNSQNHLYIWIVMNTWIIQVVTVNAQLLHRLIVIVTGENVPSQVSKWEAERWSTLLPFDETSKSFSIPYCTHGSLISL